MMRNLYAYYIAALVAVVLLFDQKAQAQDIHFTENYATPILINPALTGLFNGSGVRITGIYRNQWRSITKDAPYRTISASVDMNTIPGAFANDQFSVGLLVYSDQAGDLRWSTNHFDLSFGYASAFGDFDNHYLSFGAMAGGVQRSVDYTEARFESQFDGTGHNGLIPSGEDLGNDNLFFVDFSTGMMYYYAPDRRRNFFFGVGLYHINRPVINFVESNPDHRLHAKVSAQVGGRVPIGEDFDLLPSVYFLKQGPNTKMDGGVYISYLFEKNRNSEKAIGLGVLGRIGGDQYDFLGTDAVTAALRMDIDQLTLGLAYDFNISNLNNATNGRGAIELAMIYIIQTKKRSKILYCPRF